MPQNISCLLLFLFVSVVQVGNEPDQTDKIHGEFFVLLFSMVVLFGIEPYETCK